MKLKAAVLSVLLAVALLAPAASALAAEAPPVSKFSWASFTFTETAFNQGGKSQVFGARFIASYALPYGFRAVARVDASALQDGGAVEVDVADPATFSTLELYGGINGPAWHGLALAGIYGQALPIEGGNLRVLEKYPQTIAGGVRVGIGESWAYGMVGTHDAAGSGLRLISVGQIHLQGRTSLVYDAAVDPRDLSGKGFYRGGVAIRLK